MHGCCILLPPQTLPNSMGPDASTDRCAAMVGEKARENVPAWTCFETRPEHFQRFFARLLTVKAERQLSQTERVMYLLFMIHAFQSLENAAVWEQVRQLVGLPLWLALSPGRRKVSSKTLPRCLATSLPWMVASTAWHACCQPGRVACTRAACILHALRLRSSSLFCLLVLTLPHLQALPTLAARLFNPLLGRSRAWTCPRIAGKWQQREA